MRNFITATISILVLIGCDVKPAVTPPNTDPMFTDHWTPASPDGRGPGSIDPIAESEGKLARRVSVDELRRSIPALFGDLTWTVPQGRQELVGFNALSRTLGEADYIQTTVNNLDPSPLFFKFMDDMAGDVCQKAIDHDQRTASPSDRYLMREADTISNLRYLRLKLHGLWVPEGSTDGLDELEQLFDDIVADTSDQAQGWYGVCVAMLTAPEFMAY
jgi:hypothetical protein